MTLSLQGGKADGILEMMTVEELVQENQEAMMLKESIRAYQLRIAKLLDRRSAEAKLAAMSDADREALAQVVADAGGIASAEKVNGD